MLIDKLEKAEEIVKNFKDLRWVGWDIVSRKQSKDGYSNKYGSFINGSWGIDKTYKLTNKGWHLPNGYGEKNEE